MTESKRATLQWHGTRIMTFGPFLKLVPDYCCLISLHPYSPRAHKAATLVQSKAMDSQLQRLQAYRLVIH